MDNNTIPKRIFYCWFGEHKPDDVIECIDNWKQTLPDYEIIELNEKSTQYFDFNAELKNNLWFKTCYKKNLWAYCSDYVRLKVLYEFGGIYLDTDILIQKSFDDLLDKNKLILGWENEKGINAAVILTNAKNNAVKKILDFYENDIWDLPYYTIPSIILNIFKNNYDLKACNKITENNDFIIFPDDYFYPLPYENKDEDYDKYLTQNSYTVHLWNASWVKDNVLFFLNNKHQIPLNNIHEAYQNKILLNEVSEIKNQLNNITEIKMLLTEILKLHYPKISTTPKLNFLERIFSIKNSLDRKHKIITVLNIKFKIRKNQ